MPEFNWPMIIERKYSATPKTDVTIEYVQDPSTGDEQAKLRQVYRDPGKVVQDKDDLFQYHNGLRECYALQLQLPRPLRFNPRCEQHWELLRKIVRNRNWTDQFARNLQIPQEKRECQFPKLEIWEMGAMEMMPERYAEICGKRYRPVTKKRFVFETWGDVESSFNLE